MPLVILPAVPAAREVREHLPLQGVLAGPMVHPIGGLPLSLLQSRLTILIKRASRVICWLLLLRPILIASAYLSSGNRVGSRADVLPCQA